MATYTAIYAYDADIRIPQFSGLQQYGDGIGAAPIYAMEAANAETPAGVLQPAAKPTVLTPELTSPIKTLARLYRRWWSTDANKEVLVAASAGKLYYMTLPAASAWVELSMPTGVTSFTCDEWSWATYEINVSEEASTDILLLSNAKDGMVMLRGDDLTLSTVETPHKFGVISRYAERIWGGAIDDDPDMLAYSAPYDPTNWEEDLDIPEDGAGEIMQPSWDGDSFTALRAFGSQLIAFKKTRVWRVLGTDPGEYTFKEQYGGGAPYEDTIAVDNERIFMLTNKGVAVYDGANVSDFQQETCCEFWKRLNLSKLSSACATVWHGNYYCAVPIDGSAVNNAVIVYNGTDGTWLVRTDVNVQQFLACEDALYMTSSVAPGKIYKWNENSWEGTPTDATVRWVTPWIDLGYKRISKMDTRMYITCEVENDPVTLKLTLRGDTGGYKQREIRFEPLSARDKAEGKATRTAQVHFWGTWRRAQVMIEATGQKHWRIIGGLHLCADLDSNGD